MNGRAEAVTALHARGARLCRFVWDEKAQRKKAYQGDATDMRGCTLAEALAWADDKWLAINAGDLRLAVVDQDHGGEAAREALHELLPTPLHWYPTREDRSRSHSLYPVEKGTPASKFDWQNGEVFGPQQWAIVRDFIGLAAAVSEAESSKPGSRICVTLTEEQLRQLPGRESTGNGAARRNGRAMVTDYDRAKNYRAQDWTPGEEGGPGRNNLLNDLVFACGLADDEALAEEITAWVIDAGHQPERPARATLASGWTKGQEARDEALSSASDLTPLGIHLRWMSQRGNEWRYLVAGTSSTGTWAKWDGARFKRLATGYVFRDCKALTSHVADEVLQRANNVKVARRATKPLRQPSFVSDVVKFNAAECIDRVEDYDADALLLNCLGGIVNLVTGEIAPHDRARKFLKVAGATPSSAPCPTWERCLSDWSGGDVEMVHYLQRLVGYSLRGDNEAHCVTFLYGPGANGKSVFLRVIQALHGDYGETASHRVFTADKQDDHPTSLAALVGSRLASIPEVPPGARFDEEALKRASGGDELTARFMRQDYFTFTPQFLPLIVGNEAPATRDVGESMKRRLHVVPFDYTVPKDQRDTGLLDKLLGEIDAVMGWAIAGHLQYLERGLDAPAKVLMATEEYFSDNDRVGLFLARATAPAPEERIAAALLYGDYADWVRGQGGVAGVAAPVWPRTQAPGLRQGKDQRRVLLHWDAAPRWGLLMPPTPPPTPKSAPCAPWLLITPTHARAHIRPVGAIRREGAQGALCLKAPRAGVANLLAENTVSTSYR